MNKKNAFILIIAVFSIFLFEKSEIVNANDKISSVKINKILNYRDSPTLFVEDGKRRRDRHLDISDDDYYENSTIKYASNGTFVRIYFGEDIAIGDKIYLNLENAEWFFRSTENYGNDKIGNTIAIENFSGGIENFFESTYHKDNGLFVPDYKLGKTGTYYRKKSSSSNEYIYTMNIQNNGKKAVIELSQKISKGDSIIVPLVILTTNYQDVYLNVEKDDFNNRYTITNYFDSNNSHKNNKNYLTKTSTDKIVYGYEEFKLPDITIRELKSSISNGTFELVAPHGYIFVPNSDDISINSSYSRNILDMKDDDNNYIINVSVGGGIEWVEGYRRRYDSDKRYDERDRNAGIGERDEDYKIYYRGNNKESVYIRLRNIYNDKNNSSLGRVVISGLKLININGNQNEDIYLDICNVTRHMVTEESFKVAENTGNSNSNKKLRKLPTNNLNHSSSINDNNNEKLIDVPEFILES